MSHKTRSLRDLKRNKPTRSPYNRVLIVTEGKKTEPYYFEAMKDDLKLNTANIEIDGDSAPSPRSIVAYAKKRYKDDLLENGKQDCFDRVYCVFDKDEHSTFTEAIDSIKTASLKGVYFAITSIPCFEFWLLLHFTSSTKPYFRSGNRSPAQNAEHDLKVHLPDYQKGDKTTYHKLKPRIDTALLHAKRVNAAAKTSNFDNHSTSIPELIEYLHNLKKR